MTTREQRIEEKKLSRAEAAQAAAELWESFDDNQKHGVRFGLFPAGAMQDPKYAHIESRRLSVALMDCAERDGGMIM
ncbi:MAG: hypothetical protein ACYSWU_22245 [Planctomycetota bacterium]|jgi:hypothetical protein